MLSSLHIQNYILIDSLDISFPEGLVIITGQTGAGKSILLGALSLLSGCKADASQISDGAQNCVVEAEFTGEDERIREILEENGAEYDSGNLVIRRVVNISGRSRSFVNDCPVPVTVLPEIFERLIDIHSQHKSLILTDKAFQLRMLDYYAGNTALLQKCGASWRRMQSIKAELAAAEEKLNRMSAEGDYNAAQFRQLDEASLVPGELEELEAEQKSLSNAEQIKESLAAAINILDPQDSEGFSGVVSALRDASRQLSYAGRYLPAASELTERMESSRIELDDVCSCLQELDAKVDLSPERLAAVEERLSLLYTLLKKHSCSSVEELIALRDELSGSALSLEDLEDRCKELRKELAALEKEYDGICADLRAAREKAAPGFSDAILASLKGLELERSVFDAVLSEAKPGASGKDSVCLRFSSNGTAPVDIAKCASGGELSRIMLSLKAIMAKFVGMPTLVFDEIDTGVSGSVADKMGAMICAMGADMQVFAITHLPQVAAKGKAHYVVEKEERGNAAVSSIRRLSGEERVQEIARLLSGSSITEAAVANARSLLETA